jgi:proton-translocating NADH-quinone oxidoreductase chain N
MAEMASLIDPLLFLVAGAVAIVIVSKFTKSDKVFGAICIVALGATLYPLLQFLPALPLTYTLDSFLPPAGVQLYADQFSLFLALMFIGIALTVTVYSLRHMEVEDGLDKYYALLLTMMAGLIGILLSGDLFTLYVFWELMAISSYALVSFRSHKWEPLEAGFKYLVMSAVGSLIALYGISIIYSLAGTLNIHDIALRMSSIATPEGYFAIAAIVVGFGVTAGIVPFHSWLPYAYPAAPSPVSALLSGVEEKAAIYVIFRILFSIFAPSSYDFGTILIALGFLTIIVANLMVFSQRDIKRFLSYSSIANIGFIVVAGGVAAYILHYYPGSAPVAYLALAGAVLHILNHAIGKGLLFLGSGCFIRSTGSREISDLEGVARKMPYSGTSFSIGLFHLAGVPPLGGFWSKLLIILAPASLISDPVMAACTILLIANSFIAGGYYIWLVQRIAFKGSKEVEKKDYKEAPLLMLIPVVVLAASCILISLALPSVMSAVSSAASAILGGV